MVAVADGAIRISPAQFEALGAPSGPYILEQLIAHIEEQFPDIAELGDPLALAREAIDRADLYGYATLAGYAHFANFIAFGGPEFDSRHLDRTAEAIRAALKSGDGDDDFARVYALLEGEAT